MKKRILLVYLNQSLKSELEEIVNKEGFHVFSLQSIDKMNSLLKVDPHFDLIMIETHQVDDFLISEIKKIKSDQKLTGIPIILILDRDNVLDQLTILEVGADDFILTPLEPIQVQLHLRILNNLLEMRKKMLQLETQLALNKELQKIVTTISHYINNALTPIINYSSKLNSIIPEENMSHLFQNHLLFLQDLIQLLNKYISQKNYQTAENGIYKGFLIDIDEEVKELKRKHKIK